MTNQTSTTTNERRRWIERTATLLVMAGGLTIGGCAAGEDPSETGALSSALKGGFFGRGPRGTMGPIFGKRHSPGPGGHAVHGCTGGRSVPIVPDATGWVSGSSNPLGIQGAWYAFADGYDYTGARDGTCQTAGHDDAECSMLTAPIPAMPFTNQGGVMCTAGTAKLILPIVGSTDGSPDYANMWGVGIGLDFADSTAGAPKGVFDARAHQVIGVSFDLSDVPTGLRVAFPTPASDAGTLGPDYWGATSIFPPSPAVKGTNTVLFDQVHSPEASPRPLDSTVLEGIQFLVASNTSSDTPLAYCVSNLKLLLAPQ
jgi:hypothetical protein